MKRTNKILILILLLTFVFSVLFFAVRWIMAFPDLYPDNMLIVEMRVSTFLERITLPIKLAKLSLQEPDAEVLMPVFGIRVSQVTDTWNAPRSDNRVHEGQDIFADKGTPVFSGTYGYVTRIRTTEIGGNYVSITGAGGRRYYHAHLDRVAEGLKIGQEVTTDTLIGYVGNTGNAESTPYHLHFGIYEVRTAIDPLPLLVNRQ